MTERVVKAIKFAQKSQSLYPTEHAATLLNELKAEYKAYYKKDYESEEKENANQRSSNGSINSRVDATDSVTTSINNATSNNINNNNASNRRNTNNTADNNNNNNNSNNNNSNANLRNTGYNLSSHSIPQNVVEVDTSFLENSESNANETSSNALNNIINVISNIFDTMLRKVASFFSGASRTRIENFKIHNDWKQMIYILFGIFIFLVIYRFLILGHAIGYPPISINEQHYNDEYGKSRSEYYGHKSRFDANRENRHRRNYYEYDNYYSRSRSNSGWFGGSSGFIITPFGFMFSGGSSFGSLISMVLTGMFIHQIMRHVQNGGHRRRM